MPGSREAAALALVAVLLLTGCGSAVTGGGGEPSATLTPAAVPGPSGVDSQVIAPGLTEHRVYAVRSLRAAHRRTLADGGFRLYRTRTIYPRARAPSVDDADAPATNTPTRSPRPTGTATRPPDTTGAAVTATRTDGTGGTPVTATGTAPAGAPAATTTAAPATGTAVHPPLGPNGTYDRIVIRTTVAGPERYTLTRIESSARAYRTAGTFSRIDVWFAGGVNRNRLSNGRGVVRYWGRDRIAGDGPIADPSRARYAAADLAAFRYRVADRRPVDGTTRYRLVGERLRPDRVDTPPLVTDPRDGRLFAVVDERGVVRRYRLAYDATLEGRPVRVVKTHRIVTVGEADLPRPSWLPAANRSVAEGGALAGGGGN